MNIQLTIGGDDFTDYVVSSERHSSICVPISELTLELAPDLPREILTYEEVVFYENGTKVFTGYTDSYTKGRMPANSSLVCFDVLIRAKDTWLADTDYLISNGEQAVYWIGQLLNLAGLTYTTSIKTGVGIFPGYGWSFTTVLDALSGLLQMTPYQIYANAEGVVVVKEISRSDPVMHDITEFTSYERLIDDSYIRNRVVVYGDGFVVEKSESSPYLQPGEVRTVAVATGQIHQYATANSLASKMLEEFSEPMDEKIINMEADPSYIIGEVVSFAENFTGYSRADAIITDLTVTRNAEQGYMMEVTLDRKCNKFWGWDSPTEEPFYIYAGTYGAGVWRGAYDGYSVYWSAINNGLTGNNLKVNDVKVDLDGVIWIATDAAVFYSTTYGESWVNITPDNPAGITGSPIFSTVCVSELDTSKVYVLADGIPTDVPTAWLYLTLDSGSTWKVAKIGGAKIVTTVGDIVRFSDGYAASTILSPEVEIPAILTDGSVIFNNNRFKIAFNYMYYDPAYHTGHYNYSIAPEENWTFIFTDTGRVRDLVDNGDNYYILYWGYVRVVNSVSNDQEDFYAAPTSLVTNNGITVTFPDGWRWLVTLDGDVYIKDNSWGIIAKRVGAGWSFAGQPGYEFGGNYFYSRLVAFDSKLWLAGASKNYLTYSTGDGSWAEDAVLCDENIFYHCVQDGEFYVLTENYIYKYTGAAYVEEVPVTNVTGYGLRQIFKVGNDWFAMAINGYIQRYTDDGWVHITEGEPYPNMTSVVLETPDKQQTHDHAPPSFYNVPDDGRTHLLDLSADETYIYATVLDEDGYPVVFRMEANCLLSMDDVLGPFLGTWAGVVCDPYIDSNVWTFGDFGEIRKVNFTEDNGGIWYNRTPLSWWGDDILRPIVFGYSINPRGYFVNAKTSWEWDDTLEVEYDRDHWKSTGPIPLSPNCGIVDTYEDKTILGNLVGAPSVLQISDMDGQNWVDFSSGINKSYKITAIAVGAYE